MFGLVKEVLIEKEGARSSGGRKLATKKAPPMASKSKGGQLVAEKNHNLTAESQPLLRERSRSRSPNRSSKKKSSSNKGNKTVSRLGDYATNKDHDIFSLPNSDYSVMLILTAVALCVRLFRIYQPSSVVFDEVQ